MSLTSALHNAYTGLSVTARLADATSQNLANALTEDYARRDLALTPETLGGGVAVAGESRATSPYLTAERRLSDAAAERDAALAAAAARLADSFGAIGEDGELSARVAAFEAALTALADTPESAPLQEAAIRAARDVAAAIGRIDDRVTSLREDADATVAVQIDALNDALRGVEALNADIRALAAAGRGTSALEDQRQALIDEIGRLVPVRAVRRDGGEVALFSTGGAVLLEGRANLLDFTPTGAIARDMTLGSGGVSGVVLGGLDATPGASDLLEGGALAASFAIRDDLAPETGARLDAVARDLIERFADPAVDPTLAAGDPALFTDAGAAFDPPDEVGLAGRIAVNAAADPLQGGAAWRLRDGLNAAAPGEAGAGSILRNLVAAMSAPRTPPAGAGLAGRFDAAGLAAELSSRAAADRFAREEGAARAQAARRAVADAEFSATRVDSDAEMTRLLAIERAYAANARVIQTVDAMFDRLMEI